MLKLLNLTLRTLFISFLMAGLALTQDWANLSRYSQLNSQLEQPSPKEQRIVFLGNSITEGWGRICPDFFLNNIYINRGISGQTSPQMLLRFRADVINLKPAVVIILAGTNDIAGNTGPSTLEMIMNNIISMAELAQANGIKVILASVLPTYSFHWKPNLHPAEKIVTLNVMLEKYAAKNNFIYLDYYSSMVNARKGLQDKYTYDGVHPNEAGYRLMAPLAEEAILKAISDLKNHNGVENTNN